jgi:hypothetical protein
MSEESRTGSLTTERVKKASKSSIEPRISWNKSDPGSNLFEFIIFFEKLCCCLKAILEHNLYGKKVEQLKGFMVIQW